MFSNTPLVDLNEISSLIGVRVTLAQSIGPAYKREWTWQQIFNYEVPAWLFEEPPYWLRMGEITWRDPRGPIELHGLIREGFEAEARKALVL